MPRSMLDGVRAAKHIIVRKDRPKERTRSGLYIPETMPQVVQWGQVVCAPEGSDVQKDDWVLFSRYNTAPFLDQDEEFVALSEDKIFAVIEDVD